MDALVQLLTVLSERNPSLLPQLAAAAHGRTRNHIAQTVEEIYPNRPELASAVEFATSIGAATSRSEARRLITQGGFTVNDERIVDPAAAVPAPSDGRLRVRVGKRRVLIVQVRAV